MKTREKIAIAAIAISIVAVAYMVMTDYIIILEADEDVDQALEAGI